MTWGAIDVRHIREAKGTSSDAKVLFEAVRLYCAERESDGEFSRGQLLALADESEVTSDPMKIAATWVKRGLWEKTLEGWLDVGFGDVNPSHADREAARQKARDWRLREKARRDAAVLRTGTRTHTRIANRTGQDSRGELSSADAERSLHQVGDPPDSENSSGDSAREQRTKEPGRSW